MNDIIENNGEDDTMWKVGDVAVYLGVIPHTVYAYVRRGVIPGVVRIGGGRTIRFRASAVIDWVREGGKRARIGGREG